MSRRKTKAEEKVVRCAIYTRKSVARGLEQEFNSLDAQRESCEQYIASQKRAGWKALPESYDDGGFTGANLERPAFQRLLADVEAGKIDVVVVYKVDRLSRSLLDFARVMARLDQGGASFVAVTQNFSTADAIGRLTLNLLMSFAEFEREMIGERTRDKIAAARRRGQWTGGAAPLGYDIVDKKLVAHEAEAHLVRQLFDLYVAQRSALIVARYLNDAGHRTKQRTSKSGRVKPGRRWTKQTVLYTLRNPIYAGWVPYDDELYEGQHEAIVARETFEQVRALLDEHRRPADASRNPDYVLRGLLRCGGCSAAMTPASTRKRGREYRYYRCVTRDKRGRDACPRGPVSADQVEAALVEQLRRTAVETPDLPRLLERRLRDKVDAERAKLEAERGHLPGQIAQLAAERARSADALLHAGPRGRAAIEGRLGELACAIETAEERQRHVASALEALRREEVEARWVAEALAEFDQLWSVMTPENRGRLLRAVVQEVTLAPDGELVMAIGPLVRADAAA
ncbi:MAG: recombinase family protein [Sandaracinaceae bacterium]